MQPGTIQGPRLVIFVEDLDGIDGIDDTYYTSAITVQPVVALNESS